MSHIVTTTEGTLLAGVRGEPKADQKSQVLNEDQAKARAERANAKAAELGLKTRYEVKPA